MMTSSGITTALTHSAHLRGVLKTLRNSVGDCFSAFRPFPTRKSDVCGRAGRRVRTCRAHCWIMTPTNSWRRRREKFRFLTRTCQCIASGGRKQTKQKKRIRRKYNSVRGGIISWKVASAWPLSSGSSNYRTKLPKGKRLRSSRPEYKKKGSY